jgi:hypothetical protein
MCRKTTRDWAPRILGVQAETPIHISRPSHCMKNHGKKEIQKAEYMTGNSAYTKAPKLQGCIVNPIWDKLTNNMP